MSFLPGTASLVKEIDSKFYLLFHNFICNVTLLFSLFSFESLQHCTKYVGLRISWQVDDISLGCFHLLSTLVRSEITFFLVVIVTINSSLKIISIPVVSIELWHLFQQLFSSETFYLNKLICYLQ